MPLSSLPVRVSRPVSVAQAFPSGRRCRCLVQPSSGFGTPAHLHSVARGNRGSGGPQVDMFRVTAFLLPKSGPFTHHSAVKECRVRRRPVEKPLHHLERGHPLHRPVAPWPPAVRGRCPVSPGLAPASVKGGLRELPHAAQRGTRVIPLRARLSEHGGAGALPGTLTSLQACPGTEAQDCRPREWDLALSSNHVYGKYRLCARYL